MEAEKLETEFPLYWSRLTDVQKESVFFVVKNFAEANEGVSEEFVIPKEHMEKVWKEREAHQNGSKSYSWEEVKEMARNKDKRNGLYP